MSGEHAMTDGMTVVARLAEANLFDVDGPIGVHYSRSSISGNPLLSYRDTEHDLSFSGEELTRVDTLAGELVTVTVKILPDVFVRRFTLLVPVVRLQMGDEVEFAALGIETTDRSGAFVGPPGPAGVLQSHRVHQLSGVARLVTF
jgi:hypothetical protein